MFGNIYNGKRVLITGNSGFKGSWLTTWLLKLGADVFGISKDIPTDPSMFKELNLADKIKHHQFDLRDYDKVKSTIEDIKPDFVFHLAAQPLVVPSYLDPVETISTNVLGTTHVLESLREINNPCIGIIITSDKCYDNVEWVWGYKETDALGGKDIYSGSKAAAEMVIKSYYYSFFKDRTKSNVKILSTRAGNVIGGGDWADYRIIPDCMKAWSRGEIVEIRSPEATRPWQHVLEPLSGYLLTGQELFNNNDLNGESFNFGPKPEYSQTVLELLSDLAKYWKFKDASDAYSVTGNSQFHEAGLLKLTCDKALFHLKWLPTLEYSKLIEFTSSWYYSFYKSKKTNLYDLTNSQIEEYEDIAKRRSIRWTE